MENINSLLSVAQVLLSVSLIALVLMQHGKGADAGAAFGSGASASVFGARGSGNFLSKATGIIAALFFVVCMSLAYVSSNREAPSSVTQSVMTLESESQQTMTGNNLDLPPADQANEAPASSDLPPAN